MSRALSRGCRWRSLQQQRRIEDHPYGPDVFVRAVLAFLALPGVVAFAIPLLWLQSAGYRHLAHPGGLVILVMGVAGLLWCVRDFYVSGKGTLAPWSPPRELV